MERAVQPILAQLAIALSVFSLITYLWLGLTVLLIGNRRSAVTWVGGMGLLTAALFFLCHGALVGAGVPVGASASDLWWHLSWVPGFAAPLLWALTGMHYAHLVGTWWRVRFVALASVALLGVIAVVLMFMNWPVLGRYGDFLRMIGAVVRVRQPTHPVVYDASPALPLLGIAFAVYMASCACLPWAWLVARRLKPSVRSAAPALADADATPRAVTPDAVLLWNAADAWGRARPALLAASICMLCAGGVAAVVSIVASLAEHTTLLAQLTHFFAVTLPPTAPGHVSLVLVAADLVVQVALAWLVLLVGWAVVRQGVLVERRLPQRGFLSHWRGTAFIAGVLATVVAWMAAFEPEALPDLLLLVTLMTATYALVTMQAYSEHDRFLAQLRPFIGSLTVGHAGWLTTEPADVERNVEALFTSLCRDVLDASRGHLTITAGRLHRTFAYVAPLMVVAPENRAATREWLLPISDERGVVARLTLGPRSNGAGYTSADLEVARACGQRILDAVGEFVAAQAVASLARRRGLEAELSAALPRRVLHDEVLPRLHLAMLRLEALRGSLARSEAAAPARTALPAAVGAGVVGASSGALGHTAAPLEFVAHADAEGSASPTPEDGLDLRHELEAVVRELGRTHHDLAALMRAAPAANPRRVEHGLIAVLHSALDGEFRGTYDALTWDAPPEASAAADALPSIVADLLLGAALEAVRNAGRHARGEDLHRRLTLTVSVTTDTRWVAITVADDGVGLQNDQARAPRELRDAGTAPSESGSQHALPPSDAPGARDTGGTRTGLLTHGALVALVGGNLTVRSEPEHGTSVLVRVPRTQGTESMSADAYPPATAAHTPPDDAPQPPSLA